VNPTYRPSHWLLQSALPGIKVMRAHEVGGLTLSSAEVKNEFTNTTTPLYTFVAGTGHSVLFYC
jgi:hypothetical protein